MGHFRRRDGVAAADGMKEIIETTRET